MNIRHKSWPARCVDGFLFQRKGAKVATAAEIFRFFFAPFASFALFALRGEDVSGFMTARPRSLPVVALLFLSLVGYCRADDSPSPYGDWPDEGMRPAIDREAQLAEIHPAQADWINATYAGYGYRDEAHCRAGCPQCIHARAMPSDTGHYFGYLVGGGATFRGDAPSLDEGTWGWDYAGHFFHKHVALNWSRTRYQAGGGQYHTDGPKLRHE